MKSNRITKFLVLGFGFLCTVPVRAQAPFDSGSNGSFGPLVVDGTTGNRLIALPPDGILNCTTVNIQSPYSLTFTKNAKNTPAYILATGDVNIAGAIYVLGSNNVGRRGGDAGPGGFAGGQGGSNPSNGFGPGGGKGGWYYNDGAMPAGRFIRGGGGFATTGSPAETGGSIYGNPLLIPLVGGSGGGGGDAPSANQQVGGGGGGGAILIASNTTIAFQWNGYYVDASGGYADYGVGGGSGGSIRLIAPTVTGNAGLEVSGRVGGGYGRIRVDALTNSLNIVTGSAAYASFGANMVVFPQNSPALRITKAAGTNIAPTQTDPVFVLLPAGSPATQSVTVQATNFNSVVPLVAVLTPEAGDRTTYNFQIDNSAGGTATGNVDVQIPAGVSTRIDVWTR